MDLAVRKEAPSTTMFGVNFIILGLLLVVTSLNLFSRMEYVNGTINAMGALYCVILGTTHL